MGVGAKPFNENFSRLAVPNAVYPFFEVRRAFSTLADPPIGFFDRHIFGDTPTRTRMNQAADIVRQRFQLI